MMNTTSIELPKIDQNPEIWIDLLIDNELDESQRKTLFAFCEEKPEFFRLCTVRLMDHQTMQTSLNVSSKGDSCAAPKSKQHQTNSGRMQNVLALGQKSKFIWSLAAAVLIFAMGGFAHWVGNRAHTERVLQQTAEDYENQMTLIVDRYKEVYEIEAETKRQSQERRFQRDLAAIQMGAYRNNFLLEIENNPNRAVYYSAQRIPDFLLESLVISGHKVQIDRKTIDIKNPTRKTISYPIHVVEIDKNQLLRNLISERNRDVQ